MVNAPSVKIEFLTDYELTFTSSSQKHTQCNISNLNKDRTFKGKKGLHLCGGSVNETTGEVSGCVLDGTYTFYRSASGAYDGFLGDCLSNDDYSFSVPQFITFQAKNSGCFIKSIMIYFDGISNEFPTELYFSNAKNADGSTVSKYNSSYRIKNNKLTFMYSFGEDSQITEITLNISKWSKKKSFVKILKIKTGYTGLYNYSAIQSLKWDNDKFSDENELTFGISSNKATIEINDSDDIIDELYAKNLIFQNVQVQIYVDDLYQGSFYIDTKDNERGSDIWVFDCIDFFERLKDDIVPIMQIDASGNCTLTKIISWVCDRKGIDVEYTDDAKADCDAYKIPNAFIKSQQTVYEVLLKVCQVGLLRMYVKNDKLRITRGI